MVRGQGRNLVISYLITRQLAAIARESTGKIITRLIADQNHSVIHGSALLTVCGLVVMGKKSLDQDTHPKSPQGHQKG